MTFENFLRRTLHIDSLTPGQWLLVRVAFDDQDPDDSPEALELFGAIDCIPPSARGTLALVKGARVGGTWLSSLWLLYRALVADLSALAPGEVAFAPIVAPDLRLARQALRYASGAARESLEIAPLITSDTPDALTITRPDGRTVTLECLPASRGGSATRGRTFIGALLDEAAFFRDADFIVNDKEVYRSISVRCTIAGAKCLVVSTAWLESGLLWDLHQRNWSVPSSALAVEAPTLLMRAGDEAIANVVANALDADEENANREFNCTPLGGNSTQYFPNDAIQACLGDPRTTRIDRSSVGAGADLAFVRDSSAIAIVQRVPETGVIHVSALEELRPTKNNPLKPAEVSAAFASIARKFGANEIYSDGHYLESFREHAQVKQLTASKADTYEAFKKLLVEGKIILPNEPRLLTQLRQVVAKPTAGGKLAISSPRKPGGGHGDLVSALVAAVWAVKGGYQFGDWKRAAAGFAKALDSGQIPRTLGHRPFCSCVDCR